MSRILRIVIGGALVLAGCLHHQALLRAQEAAEISGDKAVRFEQSPGFYHYAAICRTAKEFMVQMPAPRLPLEATEYAVCWYVKGSRPGAPEADGKLVISAHHMRFMPHNPQAAALYVDLRPQDVELKHDPGQLYATLQNKDLLFTFRFSKLCPECAPGTAVTPGFVPARLDQEFNLLDTGIRHFDSGWKQIYQLTTGAPPAPQSPHPPVPAAASTLPRPGPGPKPALSPQPVLPTATGAATRERTEVPGSGVATPAPKPAEDTSASASHPPAPRRMVPVDAASGTPVPDGTAAPPVKAPATPMNATQRLKPVKIAPQAASGRLLKKVPPAYPLEAKLVRLEGTVVLRAVIEKTGNVAEVYALSGPPLLESAAVDAVKQWEYKPYTVNGEPVDVETTIEVVFALDGSHAAPRGQSVPK